MNKTLILLSILFSGLILAQSNPQLLIEGSANDPVMNAVFATDGNEIAYTKSAYKGIWVYDVQKKSSTQITDEYASGFSFKWSSDSKSILTRVAKYENLRRYNAVKIFNIETGLSQQINDYKTMMPYLPLWFDGDTKIFIPDKRRDEIYESGISKNNIGSSDLIVFEKNNKIIVKNIKDNSEKILEPFKQARYLYTSLSPDNSKIVFKVIGGNIFVMNIDGSNISDLGVGNTPKWSPDSKKIIYTMSEDDGYSYIASDIYIIDTDGSQKRNFTNTENKIEMNPSFSPDGKIIIFDELNSGSIFLMTIE